AGTRRYNHHSQGDAASEQGAAVRARQGAQTDANGAHRAGVTSVNARFAGKNLATNDLGLDIEEDVFDLDFVGSRFATRRGMFKHLGLDIGIHLTQLRSALLLLTDAVGRLQALLSGSLDGGDKCFVP